MAGRPEKPKKVLCKYLSKWEEEFTFLKKSRLENHAFCVICRSDFSVGHGGRTDVTQHKKTAKHSRFEQQMKHTTGITNYMAMSGGEADKVTSAEVKMAMLIAKKNISMSFFDAYNKCVGGMFPDSAIAKNFAMGKTKATQIIKGKLAHANVTCLLCSWSCLMTRLNNVAEMRISETSSLKESFSLFRGNSV